MRNSIQPVVLLLGSNIHPEHNLPRAVELLKNRFCIERVSRVWETPASGSPGPNFLNAALRLESNLSPRALKQFVLRPMEAALGRVRTADKNSARTIDLDVVVWGSRSWDDDIWQHAYAAVPVAELVPDLRHDQYPEALAQIAQKLQAENEIQLRPTVTREVYSQVGAFNLALLNPITGSVKYLDQLDRFFTQERKTQF